MRGQETSFAGKGFISIRSWGSGCSWVIIWNRACEELTGMKAAEMIGSTDQWKPFYPEKRPVLADIVVDGNDGDLPSLYDNHTRSPLTPDGLQAEGWYASLNGKDRFIFFDAAPVRANEGKIVAAIETLQDITERKEAEGRGTNPATPRLPGRTGAQGEARNGGRIEVESVPEQGATFTVLLPIERGETWTEN